MRKLTLLFIIMALSTGMGFAQKEQRRQKRQEVAEFRLNEDICSNCKRKIEGNIPFEKGVTALAYGDDGTTVKVAYRADKTDTLKLTLWKRGKQNKHLSVHLKEGMTPFS